MQTTLTPIILEQIANHKTEPVNARRNGKIARLPKETRDMLNRMLDDGLPYRVIIDELGEAGEGLNAQNITNWAQGGYQDYLKNQRAIARAKAQMEFATDLLQEAPDTDPMLIHRACNLVAGTQLFEAVLEYGDEALKKLLKSNPARYLTMLNTIAIMANSSIKLEQHRHSQQFLSLANPAGAIEDPLQLDTSSPGTPGRTPSTASPPSSPVSPSSPIKPIQAPGEIIATELTGSSSAAVGASPSPLLEGRAGERRLFVREHLNSAAVATSPRPNSTKATPPAPSAQPRSIQAQSSQIKVEA